MFSSTTLEYFRKAGPSGLHLPEPAGEGRVGDPSEGHYFYLQIRLENDQIKKVAYECPRCLAATACAGYLQEALPGQTPEQALQTITTQTILEALKGLPTSRAFYPWMVVKALHLALGVPHA